MPVRLPTPCHTTRDLGDQLVVSIPSYKHWSAILVFGIWFAMWLIAFIGSIVGTFSNNTTGLGDLTTAAIWLGFVIIFGIPVVYGFFWQILGREEIIIARQSIKIGQVVLGLRTQNEFSADHIKDLRTSSVDSYLLGRALVFPFAKNRSGAIAFDYGAKTFKFGSGVDESEGKQIIVEIQQKYPHYKMEM